MVIYTSYFYNIRFFKPWQIPLSTADWDPKWFHDFQGQEHIWKDKNGVWNGLRIESLSPSRCCSLQPPECVGCDRKGDPLTCSFLRDYREGLHTKVNFQELMKEIETFVSGIQKFEGFCEEPEVMLIVHESPDTLCSERRAIQDLFREQGINVCEWNRGTSKNANSEQ